MGVTVGAGGFVLYGATQGGGSCDSGTVFELVTPSASESWMESVVLDLCPGTRLVGAPVIGVNGVLYGAAGTPTGGSVFSLTRPTFVGGPWTVADIQDFTALGGSYTNPVAVGKGGVLYGTTQTEGGCGNAYNVCGTIYSLTPPATAGGSATETTLHECTGENGDGDIPFSGLLIADGVLYGTTVGEGSNNFGSVYSWTLAESSGEAGYKVLYRFKGQPDGASPMAGLVAFKGVLYGTTFSGGSGSCGRIGCGTIFSLTPPASPGDDWTETVLYSFTGGSDGSDPQTGLAVDRNGVLYGTTQLGGDAGAGTVFSFTP